MDALRDLAKLSGQDLGTSIPEAEMRKFAFVILFARRLIEHLEQRFDSRAWN